MHAFDACCLLFSFVYQLTIHTIFLKFSHNIKKVNLYFYKLSIRYRLWFFDYTSFKYAHFVKIIHLLAVRLACLFLIDAKHNYIKVKSICRSTMSIDKFFKGYSLNVVID